MAAVMAAVMAAAAASSSSSGSRKRPSPLAWSMSFRAASTCSSACFSSSRLTSSSDASRKFMA